MSQVHRLNSSIMQQAKIIALEHYQQQFSEQLAAPQGYKDQAVFALNMKDAMELYNENKVSKLALPPVTEVAALFDVFIEKGIDETAFTDAEALAQHFIETLSDTVFFKLNSTEYHNVEDIIRDVKTFSFWSPVWVLFANQWHDTFKQSTQH